MGNVDLWYGVIVTFDDLKGLLIDYKAPSEFRQHVDEVLELSREDVENDYWVDDKERYREHRLINDDWDLTDLFEDQLKFHGMKFATHGSCCNKIDGQYVIGHRCLGDSGGGDASVKIDQLTDEEKEKVNSFCHEFHLGEPRFWLVKSDCDYCT